MPRKNDIKKLIIEHNRQLQKLKEREAQLGLHTPTYVLTEIEDREKEIEKLQIELEDSSALSSEISVQILHNLPQPDYERFIGRSAELKQIRHLLSPRHRSWVVTIDGIGGIGKSALALEVANSYLHHFDKLPEEERFDAIIWTTAKQTLLTGEGIITRSQTLRTLEDIYNSISVTLEQEDIMKAPVGEQDDLIRQALIQQRTLLIIDNLETVDDERVLGFIREVPEPTKVIVTTRHRLDIAYPIRVLGMTEKEGLELIADEIKIKNVTLTASEIQTLFRRTGGVPLAMVWSVALMGFGYGVDSVLARLGTPTSDIAKFCFDVSIERIRNTSAYRLLVALSLFATDASRQALGYVVDLSVLDRDEGLVELEKLSLVNKAGDRFSLLPLAQVYSKAEFSKLDKLESDRIRQRWIEFYLNFVSSYGKNYYETVNNVKPELANIFGVMDWCWQENKPNEFITFVQKMDFHLWIIGNWSVRSRYAELGLKATESSMSELTKASFWISLATIKYYNDELNEAEDLVERAIRVYELYDNQEKKLADAYWRLGGIQIYLDKFDLARQNLDKVLSVAKSFDSKKWHIGRTQRQLARLEIIEGNYDSAVARLNQAIELLEQVGELSSGLADSYRYLGKVLILKGKYTEARQYLQKSLEMGQNIDNQIDVARAKAVFAELELAVGHSELANQLAIEASEIFTKLGARSEFREHKELFRSTNIELK